MDSVLSYEAILYLLVGVFMGTGIGWFGISFRFKGTHISRRPFEELEKERINFIPIL